MPTTASSSAVKDRRSSTKISQKAPKRRAASLARVSRRATVSTLRLSHSLVAAPAPVAVASEAAEEEVSAAVRLKDVSVSPFKSRQKSSSSTKLFYTLSQRDTNSLTG